MSAPWLPSPASSTSYPAPRSIIASVVRMLRWSSTTRILGIALPASASAELLGQVRGLSRVLEEPELRLQPVGVLLLGDEHVGQEILAGVVALLAGEADAV